MTLTEQWEKGELKEGDYYIKRRNGYLPYDNIDSRGVWRNSIDEDIVEVLAPVPSYEEWKSTGKFAMEAMKVAEENEQLKELLLECGEFLYEILTGTHSKLSFKLESGIRKKYYMTSLSELKTKIDNAIGEKK